jgi:chitin synthase
VVRSQEIRRTTTPRRTPRSGKNLNLLILVVSLTIRTPRYSTVSYSETGVTHSQGFDASTMESFANAGGSRPRYDSNQLLTLPAPLALSRPATYGGSSSSVTRSSEEVHSDHSSSHHRLVSSPASEQPVEDHYGASSPRASPGRASKDHQSARTVRQPTASTPFPGDANPFQSSHENYHEDVPIRVRGVSLSDNGPVPAADRVRRVSRPSRRTSQPPQQNRYSRTTSLYANLPPGAAAPNPKSGGYN